MNMLGKDYTTFTHGERLGRVHRENFEDLPESLRSSIVYNTHSRDGACKDLAMRRKI